MVTFLSSIYIRLFSSFISNTLIWISLFSMKMKKSADNFLSISLYDENQVLFKSCSFSSRMHTSWPWLHSYHTCSKTIFQCWKRLNITRSQVFNVIKPLYWYSQVFDNSSLRDKWMHYLWCFSWLSFILLKFPFEVDVYPLNVRWHASCRDFIRVSTNTVEFLSCSGVKKL